jgi:SAM-dependent methyltransferase
MESRSKPESPGLAPTPRKSPTPTLSLVETHCALCGATDCTDEAYGTDFEYATAANRFRFVRCDECGHVYLNPRPASADLGVIYPSNYYAYEEGGSGLVARLRRRWEGGKVRSYASWIGSGPRRVLDIGCGNGRFLSLMRDFGPAGWTLVGIDFDVEAAAQCARMGFETHVGRIEDLDTGGEPLDAVIMLQLIEHVDDPALLCKRVFALLRPGGCFIVETPNLAGVDYRLFRRSWWGHYHFPRHWNLFSTASLERLLRDAGFEIERKESLISTSAWTISLHNYFLERGYPPWFARFFHFKNPLLLAVFVVVDSVRARLGFETSNQRMVARKPRAARAVEITA